MRVSGPGRGRIGAHLESERFRIAQRPGRPRRARLRENPAARGGARPMSVMKRREFITLIGGAAAWPLAARAQQVGKVWRIGLLTALSREAYSRMYARFQEGMRELGYVEGKDFVRERRSVEGNYERFPALADELARLNVDVLVPRVTSALPA